MTVRAARLSYATDANAFLLDGGITCGIGDNIQLDTGVRLGLVGPVDDVQWFLGASGRL